MRCLVVLSRHGNTFNAGEKVVMVGAEQDLELTPFGKAQAVAVGQSLKRLEINPQRIITGPLKRTYESAEIVAELLGVPDKVVVDQRLKELSYGAWGGLSDEEIRQKWGDEPLHRWQEYGERPAVVEFTPSLKELEDEIRSILRDLESESGTTLVVTSNGRLREIARVIAGVP
ncbi:MAG: histidine phosphatase family protein, partial [Pseudomonadota bacterium]